VRTPPPTQYAPRMFGGMSHCRSAFNNILSGIACIPDDSHVVLYHEPGILCCECESHGTAKKLSPAESCVYMCNEVVWQMAGSAVLS